MRRSLLVSARGEASGAGRVAELLLVVLAA
jgi:hypothetical protein